MNASSQTPVPAGKAAPAKFRLRTVLMIVIPVAALVLAAVAAAGLLDVDAIFSDLARPALVPATGQVLFQGEPLPGATIATAPVGRGMASLGWTDAEGKFSLKTDIRGVYVEGATVGEHRVTVAAYSTVPIGGPGAQPLVSPQQYVSIGTSPLRITVGPNAATNQFQLVLEGEVPASSQGAGSGAKKKGKGKAKTNTEAAESVETTKESTEETTRRDEVPEERTPGSIEK
jgi:hypothetical protein